MGVLEANRDLGVLAGFAAGILADGRVTAGEIDGIENWLAAHPALVRYLPYSELAGFVGASRAQGLDGSLAEDIGDWCRQYLRQSETCWDSAGAVRRLHGVLQGISADSVVTVAEMEGMRRWLDDYRAYKDCWPFGPARELVEMVLADGRIDEVEHRTIIEFCRQFSGALNTASSLEDEIWGGGGAAETSSIDMICDREPDVSFGGKLFCFTGVAATGQRKVLEAAVEALGGTPIKNVRFALDYLVIGHMSSPMWKYSSYGTKIEAVLGDRRSGAVTRFIKEIDFVRCARQYSPDILPLAKEFQG